MSNYFKITGSPAEIIAAASKLSAGGNALAADLQGHLSKIKSLESDAVIGTDEFAAEFVKTYRQDTDTGNGTAWATDATKDASIALAESAGQLGDAVSTTMTDYLVQDGQAKGEIDSVGA